MQLADSLIQSLGTVKAISGTAGTVGIPDFSIEQQKLDHWCWAACGTSLSNYYEVARPWTQQKLAAGVIGDPNCDVDPPDDSYDQTEDFKDVLTYVKHLQTEADNYLGADVLLKELTNNQPIGCEIFFPGNGGHIVLIVAAKTDPTGALNAVVVADPADGNLYTMTYDQLRLNYRSQSGLWSKSYRTRRLAS